VALSWLLSGGRKETGKFKSTPELKSNSGVLFLAVLAWKLRETVRNRL